MRTTHFVTALFVAAALAGCVNGGGSNSPPIAKIVANVSGSTLTLDGSGSSDPDGDPLTYTWVLGEGTVKTGQMVEHTFAFSDATLNVSLVVRDGRGGAGATIEPVELGNGTNVAPKIMLGNVSRIVKPGESVVLDVSGSTDANGDNLSYEWVLAEFKGTIPAPGDHDHSTPPTPFSTPYFGQGERFTANFSKPGVYDLHCHPHPWMKSRLIVSDNATAESAEVRISNFTFEPSTTTIKTGGEVTWVNLDPFEHTATEETFTEGGEVVSTQSTLRVTDASERAYVARAYVSDGKTRVTQSWGVYFNPDAAANPLMRQFPEVWVNESADSLGNEFRGNYSTSTHAATYAQMVWINVSWQNPGESFGFELFFENTSSSHKGLFASCSTPTEPNETFHSFCNMTARIPPGNYKVRIYKDEPAHAIRVAVSITRYQYVPTTFGDSVGGHAH